MTNPAWVVLFTKIGGLVTDAGGAASHPAVVAREFAIPAVVGASTATSTIHHRRSRPRQRRHGPGRDPRRDRPASPARPGQGPLARAHRLRRHAARLPHRGDPHRAGARHEPGAGARGAARPRAARPGGSRGVPRLLGAGGLGRRSSRRPFRCARRSRRSPHGSPLRASATSVLARLDELVEAMTEAARTGDALVQSHANAEFHATIVAAAGNATLDPPVVAAGAVRPDVPDGDPSPRRSRRARLPPRPHRRRLAGARRGAAAAAMETHLAEASRLLADAPEEEHAA